MANRLGNFADSALTDGMGPVLTSAGSVFVPLIVTTVTESGPTDVGDDIECVRDLGTTLSLAVGVHNLGNALARRLTTPRGGLFYEPDYGIDVRNFLKAGFTESSVKSVGSAIAEEVRKDPRVQGATVKVATNNADASMRITIGVEIAAGPFDLVLRVDALTVELLEARAT